MGFLAHPGDPVVGDWLKIIESEHCYQIDSSIAFHTTNYGITTSPAQEWGITMNLDASRADMRHGRRLPDLAELLRSDVATQAGLSFAEVVVLVLYTGPMVGRAPALHPTDFHGAYCSFFTRRAHGAGCLCFALLPMLI